MHALPGRLDRSGRAIGAGRWGEERPRRGSPLGLRPLEAERPVVGELRHETDRQSTGDVAGRAALGPRARPAPALRARRGSDPPRPRAALGQGHDFAYPMYPSRHFRFVREYQYIIILIQFLVSNVEIRPMDAAAASIGRTETDRSLPGGRGAIRPGRGERRPMPDSDRGVVVPAGSRPGSHAPGACGAGEPDRAQDVGAARPRPAYRGDCASSPA